MDIRKELLDEVTLLAEAAGRIILEIYRSDFDVRRKSDSSPVTEADEAAEAHILAGLRRITPELPAVAEEDSETGELVAVGDAPFWLVDPLDGTKEFVARRDEFTVNIALIEGITPVLGVVHAPAKSVTYAGAIPAGATVRRGDGAAQPISARPVPARNATMTASRSHSDMKKIQEMMNARSMGRLIITGSSIKFCLIAEAEADIYVRYGPTREWDTAAGHAVLAAAGGSVRTLDGAELAYRKAHFLNPEFIAQGRDG